MLTSEQHEQFLSEGFIVIRGGFSREESLEWVREECAHLGYDIDDPSTWKEAYIRVPTKRRMTLAEFAPAAWEASCDLMGGEDRVKWKAGINLFAMNFRQGADKPYQPASGSTPGWHKDGWHFRHFLDSPDQGLLGIPLMTDVFPEGGGTFIAADSVGPVARFLAEHPEGVLPDGFDIQGLLAQCHDYREITGEAGDFFLLHPYLLHAVSQNRLQRARGICNVLYELKEPLNLHREDAGYSPVEAAILRGLGVDHYDFTPKAPRLRNPEEGPLSAYLAKHPEFAAAA